MLTLTDRNLSHAGYFQDGLIFRIPGTSSNSLLESVEAAGLDADIADVVTLPHTIAEEMKGNGKNAEALLNTAFLLAGLCEDTGRRRSPPSRSFGPGR